jgi:hypothetical protein
MQNNSHGKKSTENTEKSKNNSFCRLQIEGRGLEAAGIRKEPFFHTFSNIIRVLATGNWLPATAKGIEAPAVLFLIMAKHIDVSIARLNPEILG